MTCDVDEEDVLGVVGEQEDVEAARHTGLAQHLEIREALLVTAGVQLINLGENCYLEIREALLVTAGVQLMPNLGLEAAR